MEPTRIFAIIGLAVCMIGCRKEAPIEIPDAGYDYFPRVVGHWIEYQVDSAWRDDGAEVRDSVSYRIMDKLVERYTDGAGRVCYKIHRFVKDEADQWVVRDVWTSTVSNTAAEVTEENTRLMKLVFPVKNGTSWDLNTLNTEAQLKVAFRGKEDPWSIGGLSFQNTVLVRNTVPPNVINKRNFEERYAAGVGLVSKYGEETNTQFNHIQGVWQVTGWRLDMVVVAYGTE